MSVRACFAFLVLAALFQVVPGVASASARRTAGDGPEFTRQMNTWMTESLRHLDAIPSVSVAVVIDDEAVLTRGWGMVDREAGIASSEDAVYYIASATKPFTALAAALLDARGEFDLDSSLAEHLGSVSLGPETEAESIRLRDLLTHTAGIDNGPIAVRLAYTGEHDEATLWELLAHTTPAEEAPHGTFNYTNVGYNVLGMILDRETGKPWQDLLRDEVFEPLGLERTTAYASLPREKHWPLAVPYFGLDPGGVSRVYLEKQDNTMQSAGGIMTTARDMARWLECQMNEGRIDGKQALPAEVIEQSQRAWVETSGGRPPFGSTHYGLGWHHGSYLDRTVIHHSGGFAGFRALVSFMPEERIGVAVLINEGTVGGRFADVVGQWVYEWWLGAEEKTADTGREGLAEMQAKMRERMASMQETHAQRKWMLDRPLSEYAGTYHSELWGTVRVAEVDGHLEVKQGNLHCVGTAFEKPETMRVELVPGQGNVIRFEPEAGRVDGLRLDDEPYIRVE